MPTKMKAPKKASLKKAEVNQEEKVETGKFAVSDTEHCQTVKSFMSSCLRVAFKRTGLPKSKQVSGGLMEKMLVESGAQDGALSGNKRLLRAGKDSHPLIRSINAWGTKVDKLKSLYTFPMAASEGVDSDTLAKARGDRLIRVDDIEVFEDTLVSLEEEGASLSKKFRDEYDQVMAFEKKMLGKEFNEQDYPSKEGVYFVHESESGQEVICALRLGKRSYTEVTAPVQLPVEVRKRMTAEATQLMNQSVEVAVGDLSRMLTETFMSLSKQLVDRTRINPRVGSPAYKKYGGEAEVISYKDREEDPSIPAGKVRVEIAYKTKISEEGKEKLATLKDVVEISPEEYDALRPQPLDKTKHLSTSVVERLGEYLSTFSGLHAKLGAYGAHMDKALEALRDLHYSAATGGKKEGAEGVIDKIKGSKVFRHDLKQALDEASEHLTEIAEESKKVRRKLHGNIAAQVGKLLAK